jgi:hypothetical protein
MSQQNETNDLRLFFKPSQQVLQNEPEKKKTGEKKDGTKQQQPSTTHDTVRQLLMFLNARRVEHSPFAFSDAKVLEHSRKRQQARQRRGCFQERPGPPRNTNKQRGPFAYLKHQ